MQVFLDHRRIKARGPSTHLTGHSDEGGGRFVTRCQAKERREDD